MRRGAFGEIEFVTMDDLLGEMRKAHCVGNGPF
jgi:hypothetical protein